jgi:hypothetical protein
MGDGLVLQRLVPVVADPSLHASDSRAGGSRRYDIFRRGDHGGATGGDRCDDPRVRADRSSSRASVRCNSGEHRRNLHQRTVARSRDWWIVVVDGGEEMISLLRPIRPNVLQGDWLADRTPENAAGHDQPASLNGGLLDQIFRRLRICQGPQAADATHIELAAMPGKKQAPNPRQAQPERGPAFAPIHDWSIA